jgi:UDP-GlcNAc3NAcA epimerase
MQDAAYYYREIAAAKSTILSRLGLEGRPFALCTVHRAENTDDPGRLASIVSALNEISRKTEIVLPLHPRTAKILRRDGIRPEFRAIEPVGYLDMIRLLEGARIVLTDSGGLQKEAFFFRKPCVTLREETEWVELVEGGVNRLGGVDRRGIVAAYEEMMEARPDFNVDLYGGGNAGRNVVEAVRLLAAP